MYRKMHGYKLKRKQKHAMLNEKLYPEHDGVYLYFVFVTKIQKLH